MARYNTLRGGKIAVSGGLSKLGSLPCRAVSQIKFYWNKDLAENHVEHRRCMLYGADASWWKKRRRVAVANNDQWQCQRATWLGSMKNTSGTPGRRELVGRTE
jgi:hypothetical protein